MKTVFVIIMLHVFFLPTVLCGQSTDAELAMKKAKGAVTLMDAGRYEESIKLLRESQTLDPSRFMYSYEIALAYVYQDQYKAAIKELKKTLQYEDINSQVYQLMGNAYSMNGQKDAAIEYYQKGLEQFPNSGNLYLEIGNVYSQREKYNDAISSYENGIKVDPTYTSNYYQLSKLFLRSSNKVPGLIYGEIFMNLERTTERTREMSKIIYTAYDEAIYIKEDSADIDFCQIIIMATPESMEEGEVNLPYCAYYAKHYLFATALHKQFDLAALSSMRELFINAYMDTDGEKYPVILFDYHQRMIDAEVFEAYNYYLFQMAEPAAFDGWLDSHQGDYDKFVSWYTDPKNILEVNRDNVYLRYN
ncbi:tetratricopeptide repeat protein [Lewinella sp. IMCC34183]|uniref:tetratricopeptide repeat protein n=1 Tax=Lewinella sp. IMCC34183 TaxID=2248762 RepID=UPI000E26A77A|nr:tetratricopeptide repeat protein [Lewinella sp. IMCC34183]